MRGEGQRAGPAFGVPDSPSPWGRWVVGPALFTVARLNPLLDPQVARELRLIAANLLDEALGVLAPDEHHLERIAEREVGREGVRT